MIVFKPGKNPLGQFSLALLAENQPEFVPVPDGKGLKWPHVFRQAVIRDFIRNFLNQQECVCRQRLHKL